MFDNPGQKLKKLAKIVFWVIVSLAVIIGLVQFMLPSGYKRGTIELLSLLLSIGGGVLIAWIASIGLYAFGDLVDDVHASRRVLEHMESEYTRNKDPNRIIVGTIPSQEGPDHV